MMPEKKKLRVGVLFGGRSGEHAISLVSARFIISVLDPAKYSITQIGITSNGAWLVGENLLEALSDEQVGGLSPATLLPDPSRPGLHIFEDNSQGEVLKLQPFAAFPVAPVGHVRLEVDGALGGQGAGDVAVVFHRPPG